MKKYRYILFDLDGTLVYSHGGIFDCARHALKKLGRQEPPTEELKKFIGPPLHECFINLFGMCADEADKAVFFFREKYAVEGVLNVQAIPGAKECLQALQEYGYTLALATSKPEKFAKKIANNLGFSPYLTEIVGSGLDGSLHTKAAVIEEVLKRLKTSAKDCLMVGDRFYDIEGAQQTGVDSVGLDVGYAQEGELQEAKPTYYFQSFDEFTKFLRD